MQCDFFDVACMGSTSNNKLCCISIIIKIISIATWEVAAPCKRLRYSNRAVGKLNKAHKVVKEVVYEANKDSET